MGSIVKLGPNQYVEWCLIAEAPTTNVMTRKAMLDHQMVRFSDKAENRAHIEARLGRADEHGTSFHEGMSAEDLVRWNRAGEGESCLTIPEIIERYTKEPTPGLAKYRVEIVETISWIYEVEAGSEDEARDLAESEYAEPVDRVVSSKTLTPSKL